MPRYEYTCPDCRYKLDVRSTRFYNASEENVPTCPFCGKIMVLSFGTPRVIYNCDGFYSSRKKNETN